MVSREHVLWEVDTQADFMLPGGKLYVPGAEKLLPDIQRLTDMARQDRVFLVSHGCYHSADDPEFEIFPPHCVKGTPGAQFMPEALTSKVLRIANEPSAFIAKDLSAYQQILLEKQTLDIFESRHAEELLQQMGDPEFIVFGVVTEFCVGFASKGLLKRGKRVTIVEDAIETLNAEAGANAVEELRQLGAKFKSTNEILAVL
jgi:nicotinamidase/pyrazinamidase